jgi:hypothetical protein
MLGAPARTNSRCSDDHFSQVAPQICNLISPKSAPKIAKNTNSFPLAGVSVRKTSPFIFNNLQEF